MCSIASPAAPDQPPAADLAARLGRAIDELAARLDTENAAGPELAERLARAWALVVAADPELAARMARYSH